ncbi:hypothetical protein C5O80_20825 [Burkholderia sp. SRS-46]|nr:hypothetical protein C5O80_20825 [Burkholderia sp. SRS-46]
MLFTWLCLYAYSHIQWSDISYNSRHGCHELGKCPVAWWEGALLIAYVFAPAFLFGTLNAIAYKRWSRRKWTLSLGIGTVLASMLYLEPYVTRFS